ncbi:hypothetical protein B0H17DRAFT_1033442 [Mycena rosella]|uniref:Uncharacterized protein n=1 Tax=Mycena rosella TaxID=1033263 RepID=A0AAD7GY23_MYCRO|nr:hypothetical protein B0H17DRAFT_1033442 [Mycena rosella]
MFHANCIKDMSESPEPRLPAEPELLADAPTGPKLNDIKSEFHPHSRLPSKQQSLDEYLRSELSRCRGPPNEEQPWIPFRTRLDFEVSEFAQENMLNKKAIDKLITLIRQCVANPEGFTITNHADMNKQWEGASKKCTEFKKYEVAVKYKGVDQKFEMHARPLWNWALDLIQDPRLAPFFVWDAERKYKYDGSSFSKLPDSPDAKSCAFVLYADKAKLSSFGTEKAYPIVARLANIVVGIRNGNEWGGGQVVGWLPVVKEDTAESGKPGYVNFKNAVWHAAFYKLLESIVMHSKTGIWTQCGDGKQRWLFPVVLILAADYEEASVMALIRGLRALYPCPVCFVKSEQQSDLTVDAQLRDAQHAKEAVEGARALSAEDAENSLKDLGLRNVENVFWHVAHSDPHHAISFDRLHSHQSGLWGDHLFGQIKLHVGKLGGRQLAKLDQQFDNLPRWRNLNHFQTVTNQSFNDGSKHEDISKMIIYAVHNILTDRLGLTLLRSVRSYLELNIYVGLQLHTPTTIASGREVLQNFGQLIKFEDKNWNFPKMHLHKHVFDDIERKGVAKNFGTKIDEAMHGPARAAYLRQTNFKDVTPQILRSLHRRMVGKFIRDQLDDLDEFGDDEEEPRDPEKEVPSDLQQLGNVVIGAKRQPVSFLNLEQDMRTDLAFQNFRVRFAEFLSGFLPANGHELPNGKRVKFSPENEITPYEFLKVFFKSLDNWMDETDYLRCSPSFYNRPRYDAALIKTTTGNIFVRLVYVFACKIGDKSFPFALVQALDVGIGQRSAKDKALHFYRVRERHRQKCEFISVDSIVRGALLAEDPDKKGDYLVVDIVDADMFLRLKEMYPRHGE